MGKTMMERVKQGLPQALCSGYIMFPALFNLESDQMWDIWVRDPNQTGMGKRQWIGEYSYVIKRQF